ncbi:MAG: 3-hydroxyacyl-CoA dehydrogenase family protein [Solirubrobacteraceae bacterium]
MPETVAVVGSGAIACGLASVAAAKLGEAVLVARSDASAERARSQTAKAIGRMEGDPDSLAITTDHAALAGRSYVIEAIVEELGAKRDLLARLHADADADAILASTTSSLSVSQLAEASGRADRFAGLHVFNPVPRMELIELAYPNRATADVRDRTKALCDALGKTGVDVADKPGFVVNRLLFPYLFDAVRVMEDQGLEPEAVDTCMKLGAGHPMGPLALLDFVGMDVSIAIGEQVGVDIPQAARDLLDAGHLGRKSGKGFYEYS